MNKKVHKLLIETPVDIHLLGLVSSENDYRLSWEMNKELDMSLMKSDDIVIDIKQEKHTFVQYECMDDSKFMSYVFFKNKSAQNGLMLPEQKMCDFFLAIQGELSLHELDDIVNRIRRLPDIVTVLKINIQELKSRKNLSFL